MAMPAMDERRYTPEEYLALERQEEHKSEYIDGYIYAMSGGAPTHSLIKFNLTRAVGNQIAGTPCTGYDSDLMVRVDRTRYTYPDLTIVCGPGEFEGDALLNPTVLFEVLSPSTEAQDRGEKWHRYRRMPSLRQYVLVSQDRPLVEVYTRQGDMWTYHEASDSGAVIALESIGCSVRLDDVYPEPAG